MSWEAWGDDDDGTDSLYERIVGTLRDDGWLNDEEVSALQSELAAMRERAESEGRVATQWRNEWMAEQKERIAAESSLAESRRANAMLREHIEETVVLIAEGPKLAAERGMTPSEIVKWWVCELVKALSATAPEHKAWEDALWGEPVAIIKVDVRKPEWPTNLHWILQLIDISMLPAETSLYAKPQGLK